MCGHEFVRSTHAHFGQYCLVILADLPVRIFKQTILALNKPSSDKHTQVEFAFRYFTIRYPSHAEKTISLGLWTRFTRNLLVSLCKQSATILCQWLTDTVTVSVACHLVFSDIVMIWTYPSHPKQVNKHLKYHNRSFNIHLTSQTKSYFQFEVNLHTAVCGDSTDTGW